MSVAVLVVEFFPSVGSGYWMVPGFVKVVKVALAICLVCMIAAQVFVARRRREKSRLVGLKMFQASYSQFGWQGLRELAALMISSSMSPHRSSSLMLSLTQEIFRLGAFAVQSRRFVSEQRILRTLGMLAEIESSSVCTHIMTGARHRLDTQIRPATVFGVDAMSVVVPITEQFAYRYQNALATLFDLADEDVLTPEHASTLLVGLVGGRTERGRGVFFAAACVLRHLAIAGGKQGQRILFPAEDHERMEALMAMGAKTIGTSHQGRPVFEITIDEAIEKELRALREQ